MLNLHLAQVLPLHLSPRPQMAFGAERGPAQEVVCRLCAYSFHANAVHACACHAHACHAYA